MIFRWLVRGLVLAPLVMCVAAWVGSYWREAGVQHGAKLGKGVDRVEVDVGRVNYERIDDYPMRTGWQVFGMPTYPNTWRSLDERAQFSALGFAYCREGNAARISVPLWFLTVVAGVLTCLAWRKALWKGKGRGFPVEAAEKGA